MDTTFGYSGNDSLDGGGAGDTIYGGTGGDSIYGENDAFVGSADYLYGEAGIDVIFGGGGDDVISGGEGNDDLLSGDAGNDRIQGDAGNDYIWGATGNEILYGDDPSGSSSVTGDDYVGGGAGNDTMYGGPGDDKLNGEEDADTMTGGPGQDEFAFGDINASTVSLSDTITDFEQGATATTGDKLAFNYIDPDASIAGDQAFQFVGTAAFVNDGVARLRWFQSGSDTFVQADTGDGMADLSVKLTGIYALTQTDFRL